MDLPNGVTYEELFCDFEYLEECEHGVPCPNTMLGHEDCGEPAMARVWWLGYDKDSMLVCQEHFDAILEGEKKTKERLKRKSK